MSLGLGVFILCLALVTAMAVIDCRRTLRQRGRGMAIGEAVVMALSLGTYTAVCVWLGFSLAAQLAAFVLSGIPLLIGFKFVPPFNAPKEWGH